MNADWMVDAACRGVDPDLFFPDASASKAANRAKRVCAGCPVASQCLEWALDHHEEHGVWGGFSRNERAAIRRRRRRKVAS